MLTDRWSLAWKGRVVECWSPSSWKRLVHPLAWLPDSPALPIRPLPLLEEVLDHPTCPDHQNVSPLLLSRHLWPGRHLWPIRHLWPRRHLWSVLSCGQAVRYRCRDWNFWGRFNMNLPGRQGNHRDCMLLRGLGLCRIQLDIPSGEVRLTRPIGTLSSSLAVTGLRLTVWRRLWWQWWKGS